MKVISNLLHKHELHSIDSLYNLESKRLVTMSVSLCTQTGLHCLAIEVLNTSVCFIYIWHTSLTSVHNNLEHGLVTVTESFSLLNLNYTTSLVKVWIRSDMTSHAIPNTMYMPNTLNWANWFELATANQSRCWCHSWMLMLHSCLGC